MKKYRMLIACAIALLVAVAAYFIVINVIPEPVVEEKEVLPVYHLVDYNTTDIDRIDITLQDGYSYAILGHSTPNSVGGINRTYSFEGKNQYAFDRNALGMALMAITDISVNSILEENPEDITKYGFDNPRSRVTITPYAEVGEPVTILIGSQTAVGTNHYAMVEGKPEVYMLSNYVTKYLLSTEKQFRDLSITAYNDPTTEIRSVMITENGEPFFGVRVKPSEELSSFYANDTSVDLIAPVQYAANDTLVLEQFLPMFTTLDAKAVIEDGTENAAKYGLTENTTVIEIENVDGTSKKITLSRPDASGYRYGIVAGINSILLFDSSSFSFISDINYKEFMYKLLWIHNIENVAKVEMDLAGESYVLDFEFYEVPAEKEGEEPDTELRAMLNGESISASNGRRLYIKVLSPTMYDFVEEAQTKGEIEYSLKITYATGEEYTLELAKLNERHYAAILNGEDSGFYVNVSDMKSLVTALKKVQDGHELTMNE